MSEVMVSVCMITYNHEAFIREALDGVLMQQTSFPYELVIGEDCSTDRTREICIEYQQKHPEKIRLLLNEKNLGMMANFIQTLKACTGKYIALCEGDDYWTDPLKLQKQVDFLEWNEEFSICFHRVKILNESGIQDDFITREVPSETNILELAKGNFMHTPSVVFKRNWKELPKWFYESPVGDYPLHMINAQYGKIKKLDDIMAVYRIHQNNIWVNQDGEAMLLMIHQYLDNMIGNFSPDVNQILADRYFSTTLKLANIEFNSKKIEESKELILKLLDRFPKKVLGLIFQNEGKGRKNKLISSFQKTKGKVSHLLARFLDI